MPQGTAYTSTEPDLRILERLERIELVALVAVAVIAAGALAFWLSPSLAAIWPPDWPAVMRTVTAFAVLLSAASLFLTAPRRSPRAVRMGTAFAAAVAALGAASLLTYIDIIPYDADTWIRRPSVQAALALVLCGACMAVIRLPKGNPSLLADCLAVALVGFVLFFVGANLFGAFELVSVDTGGLKSPHTLVCMTLLAFVIASRRAAQGRLLSFLVGQGIGSATVRLFLPGVLGAPFLIFAVFAFAGSRDLLPLSMTRAIAAPLLAILMLIALALIAQRANRLEKQLRMQSLTDQLTNVLNRRGFAIVSEYVMHNAQRLGTGVTAFYFDLDGLKGINDEHGHEAGSTTLRAFADSLVATFRKNDVVARVGGDEFVVLAADARDSVPIILARLANVVTAANGAGNGLLAVSYSAGFAELAPGKSRKVEELVAEADRMMYRQKTTRKAA